MAAHILDSFFKPRAVAIIGLSRSAIGAPVSVLTSLETLGYQGRVYIINPSVERTATLNAYPRIEDLPEQVDLAIVSVERGRVPAVLRDCAKVGVRAAIVITQGFADADEEGRLLQEEIRGISKETGLRILGPNTIGVVNSFERFTSSFIEVREDLTPIGQVAQSGLFMMGYHLINNEPAGYCMSIDLGNSSDIGLADVLDYFGNEPKIKVVQCHLEGIIGGSKFIETASRVSRAKPVIALKAGTTSAGQAAVASHTGAVAGSNEMYRAAFRKAGIIQAGTAEELRLLSKAFAVYTPPKGKRVAIMSFSGGGAILAIDALERAGLSLASLSQSTKDALQHLFPSWASVTNPMDIWMSVAKDFAATFPNVLETLLRDPEVDAVMCIYCSYPLPKYALYDSSEHIARLAAVHRDKPVVCWTYGLDIEGFTRKVEASGAAMVFQSLDEAAQSLARMADYRSRQEKIAAPVGSQTNAAESLTRQKLQEARRDGRSYLFTEGLEILQSYGLKLAPWRFVSAGDLSRDEQNLSRAAESLKYPLCLKAVSPDLVHKSDSGGVKLGIRNAEELLEAYRAMSHLLPAAAEKSAASGILVQEMAPRGKEIMIGMKRDPEFGPCVVFGTGGIYAEVLDDFAFRLAPLSRDDALEMINETRIGKILKGVRGEKPADIESVADALVQISRLAEAHPEISEIDVNPLFVNEYGAIAVDARLILSNVPAAHAAAGLPA
jgi:acetyltransferase